MLLESMTLTICDWDHCLRSETSRMEPVELTSFTTDRSALPPEYTMMAQIHVTKHLDSTKKKVRIRY
jgi:hypothetical protein